MAGMTDIVERLRLMLACDPGCEGRCYDCPTSAATDAADEIERLQAERDTARAEAARMREAVVEIRRLASLPGFDAAEQRRAIWKRANEALAAKEPGHE